VRLLRFSRKRQDGSAPNFFSGFRRKQLLIKNCIEALHPAFKTVELDSNPVIQNKILKFTAFLLNLQHYNGL